MELKFKVGDVVRYSNNETRIICKIHEIRSLITSNMRCLYELGLIEEEELYKNVFVDLKVKEELTEINIYNARMDRISKVEENDEKMVKVKFSAIPNSENKTLNLNIVDYKILNDRAVMFFFEDGTSETTVCAEEDTFNIEEAANIAICKKKFGGSGAYNNAVRRAIKQVYAIDKKKLQEEKERMELEERKARRVERKLKRKAAKRQEQIDIQAEAFFKAMMMYDEQVDLKFKEDQNDEIEIKEIEVVEDKVVEEIETIE